MLAKEPWTQEETDWLIDCGEYCNANHVSVYKNIVKRFHSKFNTHSDSAIRSRWDRLYMGMCENKEDLKKERAYEDKCLNRYITAIRQAEARLKEKRLKNEELRRQRLQKVRAQSGGYSVG